MKSTNLSGDTLATAAIIAFYMAVVGTVLLIAVKQRQHMSIEEQLSKTPSPSIEELAEQVRELSETTDQQTESIDSLKEVVSKLSDEVDEFR